MRLSFLLKNYHPLPSSLDCEISSLALDSRKSQAKGAFFALKGNTQDGRHYIHEAIARGVAAVFVDANSKDQAIKVEQGIPLIPIYQLQQEIGTLAATFYGYPAKKLRIVGVTGTSGKTSCTHFIAQTLHSLQIPCGLIGTLGCGFYGALESSGLTTPDALTLQSSLQDFIQEGAQAIAMEVSSHSIDQARVAGIDFAIGIFTNLSRDHLDYHGDMATYAKVKHRFLQDLPTRQLILNADDDYGKKWIKELAAVKPVIAYSLVKPTTLPSSLPWVYADRITTTLDGITATIYSPWGTGELFLPLIGQFNLSNSLAVLATLGVFGIPFADMLAQLATLNTVPGRMQTLGGHGKPLVVIDYAHKPDALEKVLQTLRQITPGRLITVFGCGGERDRGKRPLMAKIAESWSDQVIITNDNPRHENPLQIVADIQQGFSFPKRIFVELDRSKAIEKGIQLAKESDCVLIAGKGAEAYQQIADTKIPFDDGKKARACLDVIVAK